jgi:chaperone BCS1
MASIQGEYLDAINKKTNSNIQIYKPTFDTSKCPDGEDIRYPFGIPFKSIKSFDNLFFDGKDALIKRLDAFVNRQKYKVLGLPETLGLLFYGEPGTGKTSCIKAIANYLNMNLIIVPMNQIKTKKRLEEIFFSHKYNIEQDKRIYVFEEIDCNGWENIVKDRRLLKDDEDAEIKTETHILEQLADTLIVDKAQNKKPKPAGGDKDDKLTLGGILEIIDGLVECPGRVIIMTTNHKDKLDPALLRPGRIDMEIEFKRLRNVDIAEIYNKWYGYNICQEDVGKIPNNKYTQAEISQLLFKYETKSVGFIGEITRCV